MTQKMNTSDPVIRGSLPPIRRAARGAQTGKSDRHAVVRHESRPHREPESKRPHKKGNSLNHATWVNNGT